jgi:hypothetical protein
MTNLDPQADKAVHDAVDAFMEGRLNPEFAGETVFETKNSRYRLLDGVVFAAPAETLIGAELVGWLVETAYRSVVGPTWQPGARAVLVDRHRGRNIIVTSTTRLLHADGGRAAPKPQVAGWSPAHIVPATPLPQASVLPRAPAPSYPAVHHPPRPIAPANPTPRPLPAPLPPPRREPFTMGETPNPPPQAFTGFTPPVQYPPVTIGSQATPYPGYAEPAPVHDGGAEDSAGWELTSAEFELETEEAETQSIDDPPRYNATRQVTSDSVEIPADDLLNGPDSSADPPILLVRPISPSSPGAPPKR